MTPQEFFDSFTSEQKCAVVLLTFVVLFSVWAVTVCCCFSARIKPKVDSRPLPYEHSLPVRMMLEIADKEGWIIVGNHSDHITYKNLTVFVTDTKIFAITDYTSSPHAELKRLFTEKELSSIHPKYLALRKSLQTKQDKTSLTEALTKFMKAIS